MNTTKIQDKILREFIRNKKDIVIRKYNPEKWIIFGSRIKGKAKKYSDIDMILVSKKFNGTKFIKRMAEFLNTVRFSEHIDAFCYTPEEFEKRKSDSTVVAEAIQNGLRIV